VLSLSSFGMAPAAAPVLQQRNEKITYLKCCLITGPRNAVVFRLHPSHLNGSCWPERFFAEFVDKHFGFAAQLSFSNKILTWYHNNVRQVNDKGFGRKLFMIFTEGPLASKTAIVKMGKAICTKLSEISKNNVTLDEENFFWLPDGAVWADIIGDDAAQQQVLMATNTIIPVPGFFETNKEIICSFFHEGAIPNHVLKYFCAPFHLIHRSNHHHEEPDFSNHQDESASARKLLEDSEEEVHDIDEENTENQHDSDIDEEENEIYRKAGKPNKFEHYIEDSDDDW